MSPALFQQKPEELGRDGLLSSWHFQDSEQIFCQSFCYFKSRPTDILQQQNRSGDKHRQHTMSVFTSVWSVNRKAAMREEISRRNNAILLKTAYNQYYLQGVTKNTTVKASSSDDNLSNDMPHLIKQVNNFCRAVHLSVTIIVCIC